MKKISLLFVKIAIVVIFSLSITNFVYAVGDYTVLAPLPQTVKSDGKTTDLKTYLEGLFKFSIGLAAVMAFVMISFGGIMYMTSDSISGKSLGKGYIENAIWGLVLVIGAYVILYTINPQLLNFNLTLPPIKTTAVADLPTLGGETSAGTGKKLAGYTLTDAQVKTNADMITDLKKYNVEVNHGPCTTGDTSGCTNLVGMPAASYQGVKDLASDCNCTVTISGGTEGGHASHGPGISVLDLRPNSGIDDYIKNKDNWAAQPSTQFGYPAYTVKISNTTNATFVREDDHWHVMFGK